MFRVPTNVMMKPGCLGELPSFLENHFPGKLLVVTDGGVRQTHWFTKLEAGFLDGTRIVQHIEVNPRADTIDRLAQESRQDNVEVVLGIGGGSVLDAAKAIAMLLNNSGSIVQYEGRNKFSHPSAPFIAVPTTCGTGSEVTWVSVVSVPSKGSKISVKGDGMFPRAAFVDADVIATLPPPLIASTGMDAMTHAIESFISRVNNPASDALALQAIRLLIQHLGPCIRQPENPEHRAHVMHASTIAGMSFGNADVGAVHCLSEGIGGLLDHPHGLLNTLLLVPVLRYQFSDIRDRLKGISTFLGAPLPETLLDRLDQMISSFPLGTWADLAIPTDSFGDIASLAAANGSNAANRRSMEAIDYFRILESL